MKQNKINKSGYGLIGLIINLLLAGCSFGQPVPVELPPTATPRPIVTVSPEEGGDQSWKGLTTAVVPNRDLADLARRLKGITDLPLYAATEPTPYQVGDVEKFWYKDHDTESVVQIDAVLKYRSEHLNLWFESGQQVNETKLKEAAALLETTVLPRNRALFGTEWTPGVDGDPRFNVLHLQKIGGRVAGYYSEADEFVQLVNPYSNEREMLYVSLSHAPVGSERYYRLIAHEMQHMIHWKTDKNETVWLNEGLSELAGYINGYGPSEFIGSYSNQPDLQLTNFDYFAPGNPNYGASFMLNAYLLERFGEESMRHIVQHPQNGAQGIEAALAEIGIEIAFERLFADWVVANYLAGMGVGQDVYQYGELELGSMAASMIAAPHTETTDVAQFGVDYYVITAEEPARLSFTGTRQVALLDTEPHDGRYFSTTLPEDNSDMYITRAFDLRAVDGAILSFWAWYEIETGWDYAYVMVSTDGGASWTPQQSLYTTQADPQGNSYGHALTGNSGGNTTPTWVQDQVDLTAYAGQEILLRFEYITDDAYHLQGFAIDEISIPQIGYAHNWENGSDGWESAGFVRHSNLMPQQFLLQRILLREDQSYTVEQTFLDETQAGEWDLPLGAEYKMAIIAISGVTPVTTQPASYELTLQK